MHAEKLCHKWLLLEFRCLGILNCEFLGNFLSSFIENRLYVRAHNETRFCVDFSVTDRTLRALCELAGKVQSDVGPGGGSDNARERAVGWDDVERVGLGRLLKLMRQFERQVVSYAVDQKGCCYLRRVPEAREREDTLKAL